MGRAALSETRNWCLRFCRLPALSLSSMLRKHDHTSLTTLIVIRREYALLELLDRPGWLRVFYYGLAISALAYCQILSLLVIPAQWAVPSLLPMDLMPPHALQLLLRLDQPSGRCGTPRALAPLHESPSEARASTAPDVSPNRYHYWSWLGSPCSALLRY
jgi:hypothetical protein